MISHSIPSQDSALMNTPNMANADSNCPTEQERERETLVGSGHVSPKIWEITNKRFGGGADMWEICLL